MKTNEQHGQFRNRGEVRLVRTLPGPIERVWTYLTDPEKRSRWLAGGPLEPRKGGKLSLHFRHQNIAPNEIPPKEHVDTHERGVEMSCVITRWEPPRVLAFTFGSDGESDVTFELTPQGETVLLVLTHVARDGDLPYMSDFSAGWHAHVALLIALLENKATPPFWSTWLGLKKDYEATLAQLA